MADALVDIAMKFKIADLESAMNDFKQVTEGATISPKIKADRTLVLEQFKTIIAEAQKQMAAGTLDPGSLGLSKLVANVETIYRNMAKTSGVILSEEFKKLQQESYAVAADIEKISTDLKGLEDKKKALTPQKLISKAKEETGFTGAAVGGGSLAEASEQLNRLEKLQKAGDKSAAVKKKIAFYTELVRLYTNAEASFERYAKKGKKLTEEMTKATKRDAEIKKLMAIESKNNAALETAEMQKLAQIISKLTGVRVNAVDITKALTNETKKQTKASRDAGDGHTHEAKGLASKATAAFSYYLVFNQLKRVFNDTLRTIKQLDKAMTDAAIVTSMNRKEAWALLGSYQELAKRTGLATSEIATTVTQFLRQGRSVKDAMELTEVAAKSAKVAGISAQEAVNYLTSAVNGFGLAANQSEDIADKFAAIAARSATSFEELAKAMSKVSPTAKSAGVSVDFMMGVIAKGIETTREAPENIGTAFKTIFARMREVTDLGKSMEDGMDLNRVEKALLSVGVALRDPTGQFRNLEQVLIDVGEKWDTLTSVEQAYLATALAGSRQQPRLLAIFNDFARTKELIQISAEATGELANQHVEYMKGSEAALTQLQAAWQKFTMSFIDTQIIIDIIKTLTGVLEALSAVIQGTGNAGQWFTAIIIALTTAYIFLTSAKVVNAFFQTLQTVATLAGVAATGKLKTALDMTSGSFDKLTLSQKLNTIGMIKGAITMKTVGAALGKMAVLAGKAILAFIKLFIVLLPLIAIGAILYVVFSEMGKEAEIAGRKASYFAERVQVLNNEIGRLAAREREIGNLAKRFEELGKKTAKSVDEIKEMNDIADQLQNVEVDGEKFNLTRTDITGKVVLDEVEYKRFTDFLANKREELLQQNLQTFRTALSRDFEGTLKNKSLMKVFSDLGYSFGQTFLDGVREGMDEGGEEVSEEVLEQSESALDNLSRLLSPEMFTETMPLYRFKTDWTYRQEVRDLFENQTFASQQEAMDFLDTQRREGKISEDEYNRLLSDNRSTDLGGGFAGAGAGAAAGAGIGFLVAGPIGALVGGIIGGLTGFIAGVETQVKNELQSFETEAVNEERMEDTIDRIMDIYKDSFAELEASTKEIMDDKTLTPLERTASLFEATANNFQDTVRRIEEDELLSDAVKKVSIDALIATTPDAAILNKLINEKDISVNVLAKMSVDLSIEEMEDIFDDMFKELEATKTVTTEVVTVVSGRSIVNTQDIQVPELTGPQQEAFMNQFEDLMGDLFSDSDEGVTAGFQKLKTYVDSLIQAGILTAEEGQKLILQLSKKIKTLSVEDAASLLKDQMQLSKEMFDLSNKLAQGDFSNFAKLVETFGLDTAKAVLSKDTQALEDFFEEQNEIAKEKLRESIAKIRGLAFAQGRTDLTPQELAQIEAYEIMIAYYDKLAIQEQLRNFRLNEATNILKRMNEVLSLQDKLANLGFSGGIFNIFSMMAEDYYASGIEYLTTQVETDFENLSNFLDDETGLFLPDTLGLGQSAIDNAMGSLTRLVDAVTEAYNRQKKAIEDRYKAELDAIKQSHSERWSTIDYTNKLAEAEDRILQARRTLMGLALSGVSKGVLDQSEKDLKKLQQERQKMVEEQAIKKAEDQMKIDMDKELLRIQGELTTVLSNLGIDLETYANVLLQNRDATEAAQDLLALNNTAVNLNTEAVTTAEITTQNLVASNTELKSSIDALTSVMRQRAGSETNIQGPTTTTLPPKPGTPPREFEPMGRI